MDENRAAKDLRDLIQAWLDESETRKISTLAERADVLPSTITRICQLATTPTLSTAQAVLDVVATVEQRRKYYAEHFPKHLASLDKFLDEAKSDSLMPSVVEEEVTFWVALMAYARLAEKERIRKTFGEYGIASAEKLTSCGFSWNEYEELLADSGKSFGFMSRKSDVIAACRHSLGLAGLDYPDNIPMFLAGNVNLETYNLIKSMYSDFTTKVGGLLEESTGGEFLIAISLAFVNVLNNGVNKE